MLTYYYNYISSRFETIIRDKSPVLSKYVGLYEEYDRRRVEHEITKFEFTLEFMKLIYASTDARNKKISYILSYFPILSEILEGKTTKVELDDFCLDSLVLKDHEKSLGIVLESLSSPLAHEHEFMKRTKLPLSNFDGLKPIEDPTFSKTRDDWSKEYERISELHKPKNPKLLSSEAPKEERNNLLTPTQKKKNNKRKKKRNKAPRTNLTTQVPNPSNDVQANQDALSTQDMNTAATGAHQNEPDKGSEASLLQEINLNHLGVEEKLTVEPIFAEQVIDASFNTPTVKSKTTQSRSKRKKAKKLQKALSHQIVVKKGSDCESEEDRIHPLMSKDTIINVNSNTHYNILADILTKQIQPTTRYEDIVTALKSIGVKVEARGNGDKRKLILPNDRKIFIYRPAVPQVGHRFINKLFEGLTQKWGLAIENLRH